MVRLIPRLDIKGPNLVKGICLEGLRVLGKPEHFAEHYYEQGADELVFVDVVASLYGRNSLTDIVARTSDMAFVPLTVGGGLRSLDDIREVLRVGADKVSLNTAAVRRPGLIREAARRFGSSTIVLSIEAIARPDGTWEAYTDGGREKTNIDAVEWAKRAVDLGAGEILVTSIDRDGTGRGFDLPLIRRISEAVEVPVIASGGAGTADHVLEAITQGKAQAVCIASLLHYNCLRTSPSRSAEYADEINTEFMSSRRRFANIEDASLPEIRRFLTQNRIECRVVRDAVVEVGS